MVEHKVVESHAYCFRRAFCLFHLDVAVVLLSFAVVNQGQKNALTLSPALCALLLQPYKDADGRTRENFASRFRKAFNVAFDAMSKRYVRGVI